jgi:hypothetical protein
MKVDKQALIKHHFWILLGVFLILALVLLVIVPSFLADEIAAKEKSIAAKNTLLNGTTKDVRSQQHLRALEEQKNIAEAKRKELWIKMYADQKEVISWPPGPGGVWGAEMRKKYPDFGKEIERDDRFQFTDNPAIYPAEYNQMPSIIKPTEMDTAVLEQVSWKDQYRPTTEEVWLSLEDMCVRRETLEILREANMSVARFEKKEVPAGEPMPPTTRGPAFSQRFQSRWYQVDLALDSKDGRDWVLRGRVKNISDRRQIIYRLDLKVWITPDPSPDVQSVPVLVSINLESLAAKGTVGDKGRATDTYELADQKISINQRPTGVLRVEQILDPRTVPIKRVQAMLVGKNPGHRKFDPALKSAKQFEKPGDTAASPTGPGAVGGKPGPGSMPPGPGGITGMGMMTGPGVGATPGGDASGGAGDVTSNGLNRKRYIDVTNQVRRLPISVVMIIDQANISDVLVAFTNSKLRLQITQFHWERFYPQASSAGSGFASGTGAVPSSGDQRGPGSTPPAGVSTGAGGGKPAISGPPPGVASGIGSFGPGPGSGSTGFASGSGQSSMSSEQQNAGLVKLSIYCVASLYERPPDMTLPVITAPATTTPATTAPSTTTPASTAPKGTATEAPKAPMESPKSPMQPAKSPEKGATPTETPKLPAEPARPQEKGATPAGKKPADDAPAEKIAPPKR